MAGFHPAFSIRRKGANNMSEKTFQMIKELTELQATSGFERPVREYMREKMSPFVDRIEQDGLGGIFGIREHQDTQAPRILLAAHMDEVGFMVTQITKQGLLRVQPLGGWNPYVVSAQRFTLFTKKGNYPVVSSSVPPHLLRGAQGASTAPKVTDILFDGGFRSDEEAKEFGVRPGDAIVPEVETVLTANKERVISKAWDNRYGCTVVLETLEALKDEALPNTLIAGANVQEEVGLRGAKGSTYQFNPDLFFAVDCSPANDMDGKPDAFGKLDEGFLLRIQDPTMITLPAMKEFLLDTAETHNIPYQYFVSMGGTDAGAAHQVRNGIPSAVIGVCARYIHTHQTLFSIKDYEAAREMVIQTIKSLDATTVQTIREGK